MAWVPLADSNSPLLNNEQPWSKVACSTPDGERTYILATHSYLIKPTP